MHLIILLLLCELMCASGYTIKRQSDTPDKPSGSETNGAPTLHTIHVKDRKEIETNREYAKILNSDNSSVIFAIRNTNTFLAKNSVSQAEVSTDIDEVDIPAEQGWKWSWPWEWSWNWPWPNPFAPVITQWVEFSQKGLILSEYPGFIPVSSCQSQEYGSTGAISFSYSFSYFDKIGAKKTSSLSILMASLEVTLGLEIKTTHGSSGSTTCNVGEGVTGQIFGKPTYATFTPRERLSTWSKTAMKFIGDSEFQDSYQTLSMVATAHVWCATSDVVGLFCDSVVGKPDWDNPQGGDYEDLAKLNRTVLKMTFKKPTNEQTSI